jgi:hypothetical protein
VIPKNFPVAYSLHQRTSAKLSLFISDDLWCSCSIPYPLVNDWWCPLAVRNRHHRHHSTAPLPDGRNARLSSLGGIGAVQQTTTTPIENPRLYLNLIHQPRLPLLRLLKFQYPRHQPEILTHRHQIRFLQLHHQQSSCCQRISPRGRRNKEKT